MKKILCVVLTVSLLFLLSLSAFAVDVYSDYFYIEDGNTYIGTFATLPLSDLQKDNLRSFLNNDLSFILMDYEQTAFYLMSLSNESGFTIDYIYDGACSITLNCNASGTVWACSGDGILTYRSLVTYSAGDEMDGFIIVGGRAFSTCDIVFPSPIADYVADYEGVLYLRDDGGLMSDTVTDSSESDESENNGILSFLGDFWDKFKSFLLGLFVPSDGYFENWYKEVKSAFDAKFKALTALYDTLTGFFNSVDTSVVASGVFANPLFSSRLDWIRGLVTGLILLITVYVCYRRIIDMISI